jgi:signal transduction histidine kinase
MPRTQKISDALKGRATGKCEELVQGAPIAVALLDERMEFRAVSREWEFALGSGAGKAGDRFLGGGHWLERVWRAIRGRHIVVVYHGDRVTEEESDLESRRLAQELHDDITQRMAFFAMELGRVQGRKEEGETVRELRARVQELIDDLRKLSHRIYPVALKDAGLGASLKALCGDVGGTEGVRVQFLKRGRLGGLSGQVELCLYRIAQEALRNALQHANASAVAVRLERKRDKVILEVSDNGNGFDVMRAKEGLGLRGMRERARSASGLLAVASAIGAGTKITATVPWRIM